MIITEEGLMLARDWLTYLLNHPAEAIAITEGQKTIQLKVEMTIPVAFEAHAACSPESKDALQMIVNEVR